MLIFFLLPSFDFHSARWRCEYVFSTRTSTLDTARGTFGTASNGSLAKSTNDESPGEPDVGDTSNGTGYTANGARDATNGTGDTTNGTWDAANGTGDASNGARDATNGAGDTPDGDERAADGVSKNGLRSHSNVPWSSSDAEHIARHVNTESSADGDGTAKSYSTEARTTRYNGRPSDVAAEKNEPL